MAMFDVLSVILLTNCVAVLGEIPAGHLKPFGYHRPPSVPVDQFTVGNAPKPVEFYEKYVKPSKPVIFRDVLVNSDAYRLWTDEYVRHNFGEMEVRLEGKKEKKHMPPLGETYLGRDNLRHFVDTYHQKGNNVYIVSDLPSKMYKDMGVAPSFGACGEMSRRIVEVDIWWSGGGSSSIIHKDAFNQMNCLLNGTKHWKLIEYKYEKDIYKHPEPENEIGGFSDINPEHVDLIKQPKVKNVEWSNITVYAGDCLFLPKSYYHQVNSEGTNNKAVSLLFSRFDHEDNLDFSDCTENTDFKSVRSLGEFTVQWPFKGKGKMVMGNSDLEGIRRMFLEEIDFVKKNDGVVDAAYFDEVLEGYAGDGIDIDTSQIFRDMDRDGDGILSADDLKSMTTDDLRHTALQMERYEPSNHYEYEYSIMPFEGVWALVKLCAKQYKEWDKNTWLKHYKQIGGSDLFGGEIFGRLSEGKTHITSSQVTDEILYKALNKWVTYWAPQYSSLEAPPTDFSQRTLWNRLGFRWLTEETINAVRYGAQDKRLDKEENDVNKDEL